MGLNFQEFLKYLQLNLVDDFWGTLILGIAGATCYLCVLKGLRPVKLILSVIFLSVVSAFVFAEWVSEYLEHTKKAKSATKLMLSFVAHPLFETIKAFAYLVRDNPLAIIKIWVNRNGSSK